MNSSDHAKSQHWAVVFEEKKTVKKEDKLKSILKSKPYDITINNGMLILSYSKLNFFRNDYKQTLGTYSLGVNVLIKN